MRYRIVQDVIVQTYKQRHTPDAKPDEIQISLIGRIGRAQSSVTGDWKFGSLSIQTNSLSN